MEKSHDHGNIIGYDNKCYQCINAALLFNMQFVLQRRFIVHKIFRQSAYLFLLFGMCAMLFKSAVDRHTD